MTGDELVQALTVDTAAKFKPWSDDSSWPYLADAHNAAAFISAGKATYDAYKAAFEKELSLWNGNAYGAFVATHDGGLCVRRALQFGDSALIHPEPPDNRYAPQDDTLQLSFLSKGLNPYGEPLDEFHAKEGAAKWATFASNPPQAAYAVFPDTAKWLCSMDIIQGDFRSNYTWEPFRNLTISGAMQYLRFGYPQGG